MHSEIGVGSRVRRRGEEQVGVVFDTEPVNKFVDRYLVAYGNLDNINLLNPDHIEVLRQQGRIRILYNTSLLSSTDSTRFGSAT